MKRFMIALALTLAAALQTMGQAAATPVAKCIGPDGKTACSSAHVKQLNDGMVTGRRVYKPLETVKAVSLASSDGTLKCEQNNGQACTPEQLDALNQVAGQLKYSLTYNASHSNTGNRSNIKNN
jgi:hypothetical protein